MSLSSVGLRTINGTISQASWELRTVASVKPKILEIGVTQFTSGTAVSYGLGRPAAIGVTPSSTSPLQMDDTGDPSSTLIAALGWGTSPTSPLIFHRRWNSSTAAGVGIIWTFPRGLVVPVSSSVVVFNITAAVAADVTCAADE